MLNLENRNLLGNPVRIKSVNTLDYQTLLNAIDSLGIVNPNIALICDNAPIDAKNTLIGNLPKYTNITVLDKVSPNPKVVDINSMLKEIDEANIIVAIGGGSVLDSAKALAMLKANGGTLDDYLGSNPKSKITKKSLTTILIPTTAGTGSEMTKVGVYTSETGRKYTLGSDLMYATCAILNADYILNAPPKLIAATGADALDHALETIWNKNARKETNELAVEAAINVLTYLPKVYRQSINNEEKSFDDYASQLAASTLAGSAFTLTGTASGHALSFILSEDYHVPHGAACAFTLLDVFKLSLEVESTKHELAKIAKHFYKEETDENVLIKKLYNQIADLFREMKLPTNFKELGVEISKEEIDSHFNRAFEDPKMWNQIPVATKENIYPFLEAKC